MNIQIIPAIDIISGQCVRLTQGDYSRKTVYYREVLDAAKAFEDCGMKRLHIVDLDGAKASSPQNLRALESVATHTSLSVQYGGGIKSAEALDDVFSAGASRAICGSIAAKSPELFAAWLSAYGPDRMILGADVSAGRVAVHGWTETADLTVQQLIDKFVDAGLTQTICTDISKDGMLCGPSADVYAELQDTYPIVEVTVSGGISSLDDIRRLDELGLRSVIVGKAIYEGRISLKDLSLCLLNG